MKIRVLLIRTDLRPAVMAVMVFGIVWSRAIDCPAQTKANAEFTAQKAEAERTIADVDASGLWPGKVVTEVKPVGDFWEAEPEHQDYLERIPHGYTCHFIDSRLLYGSNEVISDWC